MEGESEDLFSRYGGKVMKFAQLPESAKKAIDHLNEDGHRPDNADELLFGYVMIPMKVLVKACWEAPDNCMRDDYADWDEYHNSYWSAERDSDYANHLNEMWPVFLDDGEGIWDGWHRLHWYYRNGVKQVPAILFVEQPQP